MSYRGRLARFVYRKAKSGRGYEAWKGAVLLGEVVRWDEHREVVGIDVWNAYPPGCEEAMGVRFRTRDEAADALMIEYAKQSR